MVADSVRLQRCCSQLKKRFYNRKKSNILLRVVTTSHRLIIKNLAIVRGFVVLQPRRRASVGLQNRAKKVRSLLWLPVTWCGIDSVELPLIVSVLLR